MYHTQSNRHGRIAGRSNECGLVRLMTEELDTTWMKMIFEGCKDNFNGDGLL